MMSAESPRILAPRLLNTSAAAAYCGMGRRKFAGYRKRGLGPQAFNASEPTERALFSVTVLDEWMHRGLRHEGSAA
jgi:hypothetical protein